MRHHQPRTRSRRGADFDFPFNRTSSTTSISCRFYTCFVLYSTHDSSRPPLRRAATRSCFITTFGLRPQSTSHLQSAMRPSDNLGRAPQGWTASYADVCTARRPSCATLTPPIPSRRRPKGAEADACRQSVLLPLVGSPVDPLTETCSPFGTGARRQHITERIVLTLLPPAPASHSMVVLPVGVRRQGVPLRRGLWPQHQLVFPCWNASTHL